MEFEGLVAANKTIGGYAGEHLKLLSDVKNELLARRGLVERIDNLENSIAGFCDQFLKENAE